MKGCRHPKRDCVASFIGSSWHPDKPWLVTCERCGRNLGYIGFDPDKYPRDMVSLTPGMQEQAVAVMERALG